MILYGFVIFISLTTTFVVHAGPSSSNFQLRDFSFGGGGTEESNSENFGAFGILGEFSQGSLNSENFGVGGGLPSTLMPDLPGEPSLTNPGSFSDRLLLILATSANPSDTTYAASITEESDFNWDSIRYVQDDGTLSPVLGLEDFRTYDDWGGLLGTLVLDLERDTTYKIRIKARSGNFTETGWGAETTGTTAIPYLSFGVDADTIQFEDLSSSNNHTDSSKYTVLTTSTNAYNGYIIYGRTTSPLKAGTKTIPHYGSSNAGPTTWSQYGFGYTTDDANLIGGVSDRFTNGGQKYAGFVNTHPGDPVADLSGPLISPADNVENVISYYVRANPLSSPGTYRSTIIYVIVTKF